MRFAATFPADTVFRLAFPSLRLLAAWGLFLVATGVAGIAGGAASAAAPPGYAPVMLEDFNQTVGSTPSSARWTYDLGTGGGWGNNELETYVNDQTHVHVVADPAATDGLALQILARKETNGSYTSVRMKSQGKATFQYGYIEARVQMPGGQGIWPAFWMLGSDITSVSWPDCGEMDIMENIGREPSINHGSLHGPGYSGGNPLTGQYTLPGGASFKDGYHTFGLLWKPDQIAFSVDGVVYETHSPADVPGKTWAYRKPFFFILNVAVGGSWPGSPDATTVFPQKMLVDYVHVYQFKPPVGRTVSFASLANSKVVSAGADGSSPLIASQTEAGTSEHFAVEDAGGGAVALKCLANNMYVSAAAGSAGPLAANAAAVGATEKFLWVDAGAGNVALKALGNSQYVCADNYGASPLIANRAAVSGWESFGLTILPDAAVTPDDAASAVQAASGLAAVSAADADRLNVERSRASAAGVDMADAVRILRRAAGLDTP